MKRKIFLILFVIVIFALMPNIFAYQSYYTNTTPSQKAKFTNWIYGCRLMEAPKAGMGLTESIDPDTLESTSGSNNIDVHMAKNTEYGTMLILRSF